MNGITGFSESSWDIGPILMGVSSDWLSWLFITKLATYMVVTNIVQGSYDDPTNITRGATPCRATPIKSYLISRLKQLQFYIHLHIITHKIIYRYITYYMQTKNIYTSFCSVTYIYSILLYDIIHKFIQTYQLHTVFT